MGSKEQEKRLTTVLKPKSKKKRWEMESSLCPLFKIFLNLLRSARPLYPNYFLAFIFREEKNYFLFVLSFIHIFINFSGSFGILHNLYMIF